MEAHIAPSFSISEVFTDNPIPAISWRREHYCPEVRLAAMADLSFGPVVVDVKELTDAIVISG